MSVQARRREIAALLTLYDAVQDAKGGLFVEQKWNDKAGCYEDYDELRRELRELMCRFDTMLNEALLECIVDRDTVRKLALKQFEEECS